MVTGFCTAIALLVVLVYPLPGSILCAVAMGAKAFAKPAAAGSRGGGGASSAVLATGLAASWQLVRGADATGAVACVLVVLGFLMLPTARRLAPRAIAAISVPGLRSSPTIDELIGRPLCVLAVLAAVWTITGWPAWLYLGVVTVGLAMVAAVAMRLVARGRSHAEERAVSAALVDYAPRFGIYFAGRSEANYQLSMWLPYLVRIGLPFVVLARDADRVNELARLTQAPIVAVAGVEALANVVPESVTTLFYVNNDVLNLEGLRLSDRTHVHLGHGDSEKPSSYSAAFGMFDLIFVAGQAAVDRFARHGVLIGAEKFRLVGRPQLEDVIVAQQPTNKPPVVLYAPTWRGGLADMQLGSLDWGDRIVAALLQLNASVIFRPHPFSARDADSRVQISRIDTMLAGDGTNHLLSKEASALSIAECFNRSTAAVLDLSSVASDYLYTNKPLALTGDSDERRAPFARGCYRVHRADLGSLHEFIGADPLRELRAQLRQYYLGPDGSAEAFTAEAVRAINEPCLRQQIARSEATGGDSPVQQ
ncbi:MAG: CDP-glycerol glycerophosphotransferase family protein [Micropruina sp.]|nr:CDP-glycerol glycerophosphotransferase family protein [Micropruina sp.]